MSWRYALPLILFLVLVLISGLALYGTLIGQRDLRQLPSPLQGRPAPTTPMTSFAVGAPTISADDFRGQFVLVNFFASWCLPCRTELPILTKLADTLPIVGVAYKDRPDDTRAFLKTYGNPYQVIALDRSGQHGLEWGVYGVPESFLLDRDGRVIWRRTGAIDQAVIDQKILPIVE